MVLKLWRWSNGPSPASQAGVAGGGYPALVSVIRVVGEGVVVITRDVGEVLYSDEDVHDEINDDRDVTLKVDVGTSEPDSASALLVTSEIVVSLAVPLT